MANGLHGSLWVFHRAERLWDGQAYKPDWEHINYPDPIADETLLQLDRDSGQRHTCLLTPSKGSFGSLFSAALLPACTIMLAWQAVAVSVGLMGGHHSKMSQDVIHSPQLFGWPAPGLLFQDCCMFKFLWLQHSAVCRGGCVRFTMLQQCFWPCLLQQNALSMQARGVGMAGPVHSR